MLILTRKEDQSVVFPNCGIVVHVLSVKGRTIKLGFEAPKDIEVVRAELMSEAGQPPLARPATAQRKIPLNDEVHDLKNRLNTITLAIHTYNELKSRGLDAQADQIFNKLVDGLAEIDTAWDFNDIGHVMESSEFYASSKADDSKSASPLHSVSLESGVSRARDSSSRPESKKPLRLLVVDDDANERELLAGLLEMNGCQCMTAASGNEALQVIERCEKFDFALLDMHMPDRDGASTLRAIRANERFAELKVFSVSGTSPSECGATIGGDGFDGWLPKPLNPATLWNHLQESLRREGSAV